MVKKKELQAPLNFRFFATHSENPLAFDLKLEMD